MLVSKTMLTPSKWPSSPCSNIRGRWLRTLRPQTQQSYNVRGEFGERRRRSIRCFDGGLSRRARADAASGQSADARVDDLSPYMNPYTQDRSSTRPCPGCISGERAVAEPGWQRGERGERFRRLEARESARGRTGSRRDEHRPDAGEPRTPPISLKRRRPRRATSRAICRRKPRIRTRRKQKINSDIAGVAGLTNTGDAHEQVERRQLQHAAVRRRVANRCRRRTKSTRRWRSSSKRSATRSNNSGRSSRRSA